MSRPTRSNDNKREELISAVLRASSESSTMAIFFHTALAETVGIGASEEKTLFLLGSQGPLTAGEIAHQTGLTTASVTSLIDRLERKGFVHRVRDVQDRRRVIVEADEGRLAEFNQLFTTLTRSFEALLVDYTDEQLATITDFLSRAADRSRQAITELEQRKNAEKDIRKAGRSGTCS